VDVPGTRGRCARPRGGNRQCRRNGTCRRTCARIRTSRALVTPRTLVVNIGFRSHQPSHLDRLDFQGSFRRTRHARRPGA
jgi:hypothetical protein